MMAVFTKPLPQGSSKEVKPGLPIAAKLSNYHAFITRNAMQKGPGDQAGPEDAGSLQETAIPRPVACPKAATQLQQGLMLAAAGPVAGTVPSEP